MRTAGATARTGLALAALAAMAALFPLRAAVVLSGDWRRLVARADAVGLRLEGRPACAIEWPPRLVLIVRDARLRERSDPNGPSVQTTALTLRGSPFEPGPVNIRLDRPLIASAGRGAAEIAGEAIVARFGASGRTDFSAGALRIATGAGPDDVLALAGLAGTFEPATVRLARLVLPLAGIPVADRTLTAGRLLTRSAGTVQPTLTIEHGEASWLGVRLQASGSLTAIGGRLAGTLSLTIGPGWRAALARAAADGAVTHAQAQAATGLLGLLAHDGASPVLPLAIEGGRVTLAGLLLVRLPDLPAGADAVLQ